MEEATHLAWALVLTETTHRAYNLASHEIKSQELRFASLFLVSYVLCILAIIVKLKDVPFFQSSIVRNMLTVLHALDGVNALVIGLGLYYNSTIFVGIGLLCMTKLFLLHLLSRMVTGVKAHSTSSVILQTTKTYLHHIGSFLFLSPEYPKVIIITAFWRFISMNGHAVLSLRKHISAEQYQWLMWKIAHLRNAAVVGVLLLCWTDASVRDGFAYSACGHLAYLLVRMGPVFRIGSLYFPDENQLNRWAKLSDAQRVRELLALKHPYFALELGILLTATVYLAVLRLWWVFHAP